MRTWLSFTFMAVALAGCDFYFGGDDDPLPCGDRGGLEPHAQLRDPNTATCITTPGILCDDSCGPCPETGAARNFGFCESECTGLVESACHAASGCYAAYLEDPAADGKLDYGGCWQTAPYGEGPETCENTDAETCSQSDACSLVYAGTPGDGWRFFECIDEPPNVSCAAVDCAPGYHCEEQCTGDDNWTITCGPVCVADVGCEAMDCAPGYTCASTCTIDKTGLSVCEATCLPDGNNNDPGDCDGITLCDAISPACPSGTTPGIHNGCWSGYCIPLASCGPKDPGTCTGPVSCFANPPACPVGTVPGIKNECWSGYCIPTNACPLAACETLTTEATCEARGDCLPVYTGTNCTCYPGHCECTTLTFERCESVVVPQLM